VTKGGIRIQDPGRIHAASASATSGIHTQQGDGERKKDEGMRIKRMERGKRAEERMRKGKRRTKGSERTGQQQKKNERETTITIE
jgi:hypothetical protein